MSIAYGQQIDSDDDEYLRMAHESGYSITNGGPPGGSMVDFFPFCMLVFRSLEYI